ncbi:MAG: ABC transporter ATP-binding protein [Bacteroidetes bacterium]|nr:ABC transporter ATP-binding protein [Bacteroidota bacterium]
MKSLQHLNKYFYKYRVRLLLGILFVISQNFFAIYPAKLVREALDLVIETIKKGQADAIQTISHHVFIFLLWIVGVAMARGILMFLMRQTIIVISRLIEFDLKNEIFHQYQRLSLAFYRRNNTGDLMNRISEDVSRVRMYIGPAVMYTVNLIVLFILIIVSMLNVNVKLTLYVLAPLPLLSLSIYWVSDIMNRKGEEVQEQQSTLSTFVQEAFSGIRVLKSFVKEEQSVNDFSAESETYKNKSLELVKVNAMFFPLMLLLVGLSTLLTVYIGGKEVIAHRITTGNIAEFIIYVNMLTWPVASLGWVTSIVQRAAASQERINEFLQLEPEIISLTEIPTDIRGNIRFNDVSFVYPDSGVRALDHVSFEIEEGKSLAVLGRTGSGKSTLANLILRMYDATEGTITIDGVPVEKISLASLRRQVGYVPQDVFLFSDTIENNIAFGLMNGHEKDERRKLAMEAAQQAVIYDNIMEFPKAFETMVGERGITLSGGQKQRVSIARAIIRKPKILLFDDCLSAVDTKTEENILNNLEEIMMNRTSIIISHRVSSVKNADQIIVLDQGKIVERGNHDELIERKNIYFELYEKQLLEEEETN